jgi:iron complex outermembrane receptor protein
VTSITAYRGQHTGYLVDLGASAVPSIVADVNNKKHLFYQEIRAVSTTDGPFHWLAGATFLNDYYAGYTGVGLFGLPPSPSVHVHDLIQDWTAYAQAGYDITQALNFTASIRYLQETNAADYIFPAPAEGGNAKEHAIIPSATLNYALDDGTLYARWARGFKAGGLNPVAAPSAFIGNGVPLTDGDVFGPEKVDTYEGGYKQSLLDHRLQINGDIFYNKYNGLQETAHAEPAYASSIILAIVNAGSARTYGAEGSVTYQVIDPVTLGANVGYLNARYSTFNIPKTTPQVLAPSELSGSQMINAPTWQLSFLANLDQPLNDRFDLVGNVVESFISKQLYDQSLIPGVLPNAEGPAYWLTNLRLGVQTSDGKYGVAVFANNLFDRAYYTYGSSSDGNELSWGTPRIVGVQLTANY